MLRLDPGEYRIGTTRHVSEGSGECTLRGAETMLPAGNRHRYGVCKIIRAIRQHLPAKPADAQPLGIVGLRSVESLDATKFLHFFGSEFRFSLFSVYRGKRQIS